MRFGIKPTGKTRTELRVEVNNTLLRFLLRSTPPTPSPDPSSLRSSPTLLIRLAPIRLSIRQLRLEPHA